MISDAPPRLFGSRRWTAKELQQLRELAAADTSPHVIARKLKRTFKAIERKAWSEGIALPKSKDE